MAKAANIINDPRYTKFRERYYDNFEKYVLENCDVSPTKQQLQFMQACSKPGARVAVASGHGCFGIGTPILMFDGTIKSVENVKVGDVLMGDDSTPRHVLELYRGQETMYRFTFMDGTQHVFNESHILCLVATQTHWKQHAGDKVEVVIRDYLKWSYEKKIRYSAYRMSYNFPFPIAIKYIDKLGIGDYYGFEIDGNHRFLSGDFMVFHNTGKSFLLAWLLDWHLRVFPYSNALLTATNIEQARSVVWKYIDGVIACMDNTYPWMAGFFVKETRRYFAKIAKDSWYVLPKTASKSAPENLAGQHNVNLLIVVDEASGVDDAIHGVLRGALTHRRNRYIMTSQPTRPAGHFADAMRNLNKSDHKDGIYDAITMNSEESPIVSAEFIKEKLYEYGGHHSPEYQIKVLGNFPDNLEGFLIPRTWGEECIYNKIDFPEDDYGFVLLCDVAEGLHRDSSVINVVKMSGRGAERLVECIDCSEYLDVNEKGLARIIMSKYYEYPSLTIAVDGDGAGRTVILELEESGIPVEAIHWGLPCFNSADQHRYFNLRAYAHCKLREAIFEKRFKGPQHRKFIDQVSKLPYKLDERGRYQMMPKDKMRAEGIKSPDICDTCCFAFLVEYIPADISKNTGRKEDFLKLARAFMGEDVPEKKKEVSEDNEIWHY